MKRKFILGLAVSVVAACNSTLYAQSADNRKLSASQEAAETLAADNAENGTTVARAPGMTREKSSAPDYRFLQSNGLLVETAYLQEAGEYQHTFSLKRTNRHSWTSVLTEEIPLGSEKHQFSFSLPAQLVRNDAESFRGIGDATFEYNYLLYGDNSSAVTFAPGFGISVPTGNARKELGAGAPGVAATLPLSLMLGRRFGSNSTFEVRYTRRAKNAAGERASLIAYEVGQSFVWFAKPKLNFLLEAVWEREPEIIGENLRAYEREFYVNPAVRWAHTFKNGLAIMPSVGVPLGVGASRGERGIFLSITFEHSSKRETRD